MWIEMHSLIFLLESPQATAGEACGSSEPLEEIGRRAKGERRRSIDREWLAFVKTPG
jgi:hypothetical protein